jgi:hypothetical protein
MVRLLSHRQTKGPVSARLHLNRRATPQLHPTTGSMSSIKTQSGLSPHRVDDARPHAAHFGAINPLEMIGITSGQTLQLNIVAWPPVPTFPPNPCDAVLGFQDSSGVQVGTTKKVSLAIGESASASFTLSSGDVFIRAEFLPRVVSAGFGPLSQTCVASVEVVDPVLGVTIGVPGAKWPPNPFFPPTPIFGMLDVTTSQVVRLNVMAWPPTPIYPPNPCIGQISFADMNGTTIGTPLAVKLPPGQSAFLDLSGSAITTAGPVHPIVTVARGARCGASVEVYNAATFVTTVYVPPSPWFPPVPFFECTLISLVPGVGDFAP